MANYLEFKLRLTTIKNGVDNTLDKQVEAVEKLEGYINKWNKYYEEKNFQDMGSCWGHCYCGCGYFLVQSKETKGRDKFRDR